MQTLSVPAFRIAPADLPLRQALDLIDSGMGFYRSDLSLVFGNQSLRRMVGNDPCLAREIEQALGELSARSRVTGSERGVKELLDRPVRVPAGTFRIRGGCIGMDLWGTGMSLVVTVEAVAREMSLEPADVARRFRLTSRESEIALLLSKGRTNEEIAAHLYLSPHTVRNYTRRVLHKLGVRARAQVGDRLRSQ